MEMFPILNEDGTPTGEIKERSQVHRDGDLHGGVHVWIYKMVEGKILLLLQKRSDDKDSFPGCYDISSAGHLDCNETFVETALREVKEELNLDIVKEELVFLFTQRISDKRKFYGKDFNNNEIHYVYLLKSGHDLTNMDYQKSEISELRFFEAQKVLDAIESKDERFCIIEDELREVINYIKKVEQNLNYNVIKS